MFLLVLLISLGSGVFVLHFNNVLSTREGEIEILDLCWYLSSILHPSSSPFSSPSLLCRLFSSPPAVSTGRMPGGSWGSDSSSSGVKEGKTTLKRGEKGESKGKNDRKDNVKQIRQKRVTPSTLVDRPTDSNDRQMGFGGAWTERVIEKQDSGDAFSVIVTPQLYSKISGHSFTTRNTIQLKVLQLISLMIASEIRHICVVFKTYYTHPPPLLTFQRPFLNPWHWGYLDQKHGCVGLRTNGHYSRQKSDICGGRTFCLIFAALRAPCYRFLASNEACGPENKTQVSLFEQLCFAKFSSSSALRMRTGL